MKMVDIIAQHASYSTWDEVDEVSEYWYVGCDGCDWQQELVDAPGTDSAAHVVDELVKAGFGMHILPLPSTEG